MGGKQEEMCTLIYSFLYEILLQMGRERDEGSKRLTLVNVILLFTTGRGLLLAAAAAAHFAGHAFEFIHASCLVED